MAKSPFQEKVFKAREDAIVASVNRFLAEKGFEAMTLDEIAADVGVGKPSLYKHYKSKEELAAAAMVRVLERALEFAEPLERSPGSAPADCLARVIAWVVEQQLAGQMPSLPAQNSSLHATLLAHQDYLDRLMKLSTLLERWIDAGRLDGTLSTEWPREFVLYKIYAQACDPVVGMLKSQGQFSAAQIVAWTVQSCLSGLGVAPGRRQAAAPAPARQAA